MKEMTSGKNHIICGAKTKLGEPCKRSPMIGKERCILHGGKSLGAWDSSRMRHGRYSKFLPKRLLERYEASEADTDLLNLRSEISLIDARLEDLLGRLDRGESGETWAQARQYFTDLEYAFKVTDAAAVTAAMDGLKKTIMRAQSDYGTWRELQVCLEQRRRLVDSEGKRLQMMQQYITSEQAMLFVTTVMASVTKNVSNVESLEAIRNDIMALIGPSSRQYSLVEGE